MPRPGSAVSPVVILRLRGKTRLGATAIEVLAGYSRQLRSNGGRLCLAGLEPELYDRLQNAPSMREARVRLYQATAVVGFSAMEAFQDAQAWLERERKRTAN